MSIDLPLVSITDETNCAQLTAKLILDHFGVDPSKQPLHLIAGMERGWNANTVCGSVLGGMLALNHMLHQHGATQSEIQTAHNTFRQKFIEDHGSANCDDILNSNFDTEDTTTKIKQHRFCGHLIDNSSQNLIGTINYLITAIDPIMQWYNGH